MLQRFFLLTAVLACLSAPLSAQPRLPYEALRQSNRNPSWHRQTLTFPGTHPDSITVSTVFRIPYSSIVFRKAEGSEARWTAELSISFDALTATARPSNSRSRRRAPADPETTLGRVVWTRTLSVDSFDASRSDTTFVQGVVTLPLPKRPFRMVPLIQVNGQTSPIQALPAPESPDTRAFVQFVTSDDRDALRLVNMGSNIIYGRTVDLVLGTDDPGETSVQIWRMDGTKDSTLVWESNTRESPMIGRFAGFRDLGDGIGIDLSPDDHGPYAHRFSVPTGNFRNRPHRILVARNGERIHRADILPRWFDIPTSLLNLDTAIDMMRFALSAEALRDMRRGTEQERERKFNAYWEPRDPTPDSAYNELMAEYFARIDHAYDAFTTPSRPGFDSPMGKTWIQFGKPVSVERRFPPEGGTLVVWEYPNRRFIFRATSGFGDFELVSPP